MCIGGTWWLDFGLRGRGLIQGDASDSLPSEFDLLGQNLLVVKDLLHDFVAQIHLRFHPLLIGTHRIDPGEQQIKVQVDLFPTLVVLGETLLHP